MLKDEWNDLFEIQEFDAPADGITDAETGGIGGGRMPAADEALASCINTLGSVNLPWMADFSGLTADDLTGALAGAIFQDPEKYDLHQDPEADWLLRMQYLSGNIRSRLLAAERMNAKYPGRFAANVQALREVLPEQLSFDEISIALGSPWVPADCYAQFAQEVLDLRMPPKVSFSKSLHRWKVETQFSEKENVNNRYVYGTSRMSALKILEHTLNARTIKIYDEHPDAGRSSGYVRIMNKDETLAARQKQEALQEAFRTWVAKDAARVRALTEIYNDTFACCAAGHFYGGFLTLPDMNTQVELYPHQKDAVARIILESDVLLNHAVGSGKTFAIIAGMHERYRMGLSKKNLAVVPNNMLEEFETAHRLLYPDDRILVVTPRRFVPKKRGEILAQIRDEDFVAVYISYSSFHLIPMSRGYRIAKAEEELRSLRAQAACSGERWERRELERMAGKKSEQLVKLRHDLPFDLLPAFDQLGITGLAVDEIHNFKNISLHTSVEGVVGMHTAGSKKCDLLYEKVQFVRNGGGNVIFSTGTPLTNSLSDLYVLQSYLQPEVLSLMRIGRFDEWLNNFASKQTGFEVDVDGQNFRIKTRFSSFHNLPELMSLFAHVCDYYDGDDAGMGLPACGDYIDTVVPRSKEQAEYIDDLSLRTEMIRQRLVKPDEDNLLKVTHDGRAAALDIRLTEPLRQPDPASTKAYACAVNVCDIRNRYPGTAQLVFSDIGTPKQEFNVYDELKRDLIGLGIPESEIAFIHDAPTEAKRRKLFEAVNRAEVRVLIGSTTMLGTGVNVQRHLIAIHHLDVPWKPSDMVQREGRLIRQGNENSTVYRYRYITAGTFDAYSWQILENKQRFIGQFMGNTAALRDARDVSDTVLTYAEVKALSVGDPLLKTRIETSNELERVRIQSRTRDRELRRMKALSEEAPQKIDELCGRIGDMKRDRDHFLRKRVSMAKKERGRFGDALLTSLAAYDGRERDCLFCRLHGCRVWLPAHMDPAKPYVKVSAVSGILYTVDMKDAKASGCVQRIEYLLSHLDGRIRKAEEEVIRFRTQLKQAGDQLQSGNRFKAEADRLQKKLMDIDAELERRAREDGSAA